MRVAFVGKGGSGKSAIAGTFARLLARTGRQVLAVDSDPMPGLAFSLGVESTDDGVPEEILETHTDAEGCTQTRLATGWTAAQAVRKFARRAPDGVRFLQMEKSHGPTRTRSAQAFRHILAELAEQDWSVVGDLPGGTRQPFLGWGGYAQRALVVVEPTPASVLSARRLSRLADEEAAPQVSVVVNKVLEPSDVDLVAVRTGLDVVGAVPADPAQERADRLGVALLDHDTDAPAVAGVASLLQTLLDDESQT